MQPQPLTLFDMENNCIYACCDAFVITDTFSIVYFRCLSHALFYCFFYQAHPDELGALVEILKSGMVTSVLGHQYRLQSDAKCDTMGALWRILGINNSAQRVFGEFTGFSLLLTMLHSFQGDMEETNEASLVVYMKELTYLSRLMTAGVSGNTVNRMRLHSIISSHTFYDRSLNKLIMS